MQDHPVLGAVLFLMGVVLVAVGYVAPNTASAPLFVGHVLAANGAILVILGSRKRPMPSATVPDRTAADR